MRVMDTLTADFERLPSRLPPLINAELNVDEKITWIGSPILWRFVIRSIPVALMGIPVIMGSVDQLGGASGSKILDFRHWFDLVPLIAVPFLLLGIGMVSSPLWLIYKAKQTAYVLTTTRAIIFDGGFRKTIRSFGPDRLTDRRRKKRLFGSRDLIFERITTSDGQGRRYSNDIGFLAVSEVKVVEGLIRQLIDTSAKHEANTHGSDSPLPRLSPRASRPSAVQLGSTTASMVSRKRRRFRPEKSLLCLLPAIGFCSLFVLVGSFFLHIMFIAPANAVREAAAWDETPCVILSSEFTSRRSMRNSGTNRVARDHAKFDFEFGYRYQGKDYTSNRYDLPNVDMVEKESKADIAYKLRPGTKTVCYVNPGDPSQAVLNREINTSYWFATVPVVLILVGLGSTLFLVYLCVVSRRSC